LGYDTATARIENENVFVHVVIDAEEPEQPNTALPSVPPRELCQTFKLACEATPLADQATVDFLFATTRAKLETKGSSFNLQSEKLENATLKITLDKWPPSRHVNAVEIYGTSAP
jgi:hypothetical protein